MRYINFTATNAAKPATTGEMRAGTKTLATTAPKFTPSTPAPTITAPTRPPNSAWEEDEGRPTSHVIRFHKMAPTRPANMNSAPMVTCCSLMMPPEMVFATSVDKNAPTRLSVPAAITAVFGFSAPVAIEVAMAFAVSWKPFVKSNVNATAITSTTTTKVAISMLFSVPPFLFNSHARTARGKQEQPSAPSMGFIRVLRLRTAQSSHLQQQA